MKIHVTNVMTWNLHFQHGGHTYFAHDLTIVAGFDSSMSLYFINPLTTDPSSMYRANHLYFSIPTGYSSLTAGTPHAHRLNVLVMWHITWPLTSSYSGPGSSRGFDNVQWKDANTGSHSGSTAVIPVTHSTVLLLYLFHRVQRLMSSKGAKRWILDDITSFPKYFWQMTMAQSDDINKDDRSILNLFKKLLVSANTSVEWLYLNSHS